MIAFRRFTKSFGSRRAVDALDLEVAAGEVMAVLGPNGSGKTTSIKAAAGLIRPTAGAVEIGVPPRPARDARARRDMAFLPQKVSFPDTLTAREAVAFHCVLRGQSADRVDAALAAVALDAAAARTASTLSGGMTQRLGLAVVLAADADVLLLDEPTAALDPDGLAAFHTLVGHRRRVGRTTVFSSHQLDDVARLADRVAVLVEGRLAACLTAAELAERVAGHGVMHLHVRGLTGTVTADLRLLAVETTMIDDRLTVRGPATARPAVLGLLARHGVEVRSLTVQEGRLDEWYRELVASALPDGAAPDTTACLAEARGIGRALSCARLLRARR